MCALKTEQLDKIKWTPHPHLSAKCFVQSLVWQVHSENAFYRKPSENRGSATESAAQHYQALTGLKDAKSKPLGT